MRFLGLGGIEWLIIGLVVIFVFGAGKIANIGPALGKSIRGFRGALKGEEEKPAEETKQAPKIGRASCRERV